MKYNLSLSRTEREFLYRKYKQEGLTTQEANYKVEVMSSKLKEVVKRLVSKKKSLSYIHGKFQEEFEKVCMRLEV